MFSWFRRKSNPAPKAIAPAASPPAAAPVTPAPAAPAPPPAEQQDFKSPAENPANPGIAPAGNVAFTNSERTWNESFDCIEILTRLLTQHGHTPRKFDRDRILDDTTGLVIRPLLAHFQPVETGGVQTVCTIEVKHPTAFPTAVFEYQHSGGKTMAESIAAGFDQWCQSDFVALQEATRAKPSTCTFMIMEAPATADEPARKRRIVLGPVAHLQTAPPPPTDAPADDQHPPFCACCLFTKSMLAFEQELMHSNGPFAIRLFASRHPDGQPDADCRINGQDHAAGKSALTAYAATWAPAGYEFRKQYVIIQDDPAAPTEGE
jgi:hypothetical protein